MTDPMAAWVELLAEEDLPPSEHKKLNSTVACELSPAKFGAGEWLVLVALEVVGIAFVEWIYIIL